MTQQVLLEFNRFEAGYRTRKGVQRAVGPVSFTLREGEALGLIGESGAGKSTLGLEVLGLLGYKNGVRLAGDTRLSFKPESVGFIPQDPLSALDPLFSVGSHLRELKATDHEVLEALNRAHLPLERISLKSYPHELSGGMRQRLVIAIALLKKPRLLVADEPTSSLDMTLQAEILNLFREIHGQGVSFLFITHNLPLAALFCTRLAVMRSGEIVEMGSPEDIMERPGHEYTQRLVSAIPSFQG